MTIDSRLEINKDSSRMITPFVLHKDIAARRQDISLPPPDTSGIRLHEHCMTLGAIAAHWKYIFAVTYSHVFRTSTPRAFKPYK
jgi:hypothetical protein